MNRTRLLAAVAALARRAARWPSPRRPHAATITMSGSTSIAPLATKLAKAFVKQPAVQGQGQVRDPAGRLRHRHHRRLPRPRHARQCPRATRSRPIRAASSSTKSPATRSAWSTNPANPIAEPEPDADPGHLLRPDPQLEPGARRHGQRPDRPRRPYRRLRYPGRVPEHLHGADPARRRQRDDQIVERPAGADDQIGPERDRLRLLRLHRGPARRPLPGRRPAPCATPSRASTPARRNFCLVSRGAADGRREGVHQLRSAAARARRRSSPATGSRCASGREGSQPAAGAPPRRTRGAGLGSDRPRRAHARRGRLRRAGC